MKKNLIQIALSAMFLSVFSLLAFYPSPFPLNEDKQLLAKAELYSMKFPQEKVYLQFDRSSYWSGDDIWFKAYLKGSPIPDGNLYVDLLNSSGKVIQKKMYWAQNGLAYGDFHLKDTISSGVYQIRAYTNWMRNFDDFWFFRKDLVIWNLSDKAVSPEYDELKSREVDFQFMPEGGTFVTNLKCKMAFKATDPNGKGLEVRGDIFDDQDGKVTEIRSLFKGMGNFVFTPESGRKYKAVVTVAGEIDMEVDLPVAQETGINLAIDSSDSILIHAQIRCNSTPTSNSQDPDFLLVAQANGVVAPPIEVKLKNGICDLDLWKDDLPPGIVQFTLFDQNMIPQCERLVFVNRFESVDVKITPDKESYSAREKVQLNVLAIPKRGIPYPANLSMSVYNRENQLKTEDYPNNILTHFLLKSELKGLIEDPAYYFKDENTSTLQALDNLMLTHGYRHFEWKAIQADQFPEIEYPAEECIKVKGEVTNALSGKPVPNCKLTMSPKKGLMRFYQQETDSLGQFMFSNMYFNDTTQFLLKAITQKGKQNNWIELDRKASVSPKRTYLPITYQYRASNQVNSITYLNNYNGDVIKRKWRLSDTIMLNEVQIVKPKYKFGERPMRLYDKADYELDLDTDDDELGNVLHKLENQFPNVIVRVFDEFNAAILKVDYQKGAPVLVLDGSALKDGLVRGSAYNTIRTIPAGAFDKIEILKDGSVYGNPVGGAICFFTKYGAYHIMPDAKGEKVFDVIGYSVVRKFYSPDYDIPMPQDIKDDFRNTLYWDPILVTDTSGVDNVSFYNSDQTGDVDIVVEGVTADGKLCRGVYKYNVKK